MKSIRSGARFWRDEAGGPATEAALLIALVAAVAGFGMVALGESLGQFFTDAAANLSPGAQFPAQNTTSFTPTSGS
jgi:Flp pilus assembly pilin Flp